MAVKARDDITLARVDDGADGATGEDGQMLYATCATASATVAKVATLAAGTLTLKAGATVAVRFTYANNAASPTLNIGGTGAKAIYTQGVRYAYWAAGATVVFVYDGSYWRVGSEPVYASTATIGNPSARNIYLDGNNISFREGVDDKIVFGSSNIDGEKEQSYMVSEDIWIGPTAPNEAGASNSHRLEVNQDGCFADGYEICTKNNCFSNTLGSNIELINQATPYTFPKSGYLKVQASYRANYYVQCRVYGADRKINIILNSTTGADGAKSNNTDCVIVMKGMILDDINTNNKQYNFISFYPFE